MPNRRQQPEATSLLGKPLFPPPIAEAARTRMEADRAAAFTAAQATPSADNIIWLGRRTAYLGRFRESIQIYDGGLRLYADDPRFFRHRGHRYITVREFDRAIADLEKAAGLVRGRPDEVEPDGQPNARNIPTSTLHTNIWYHLALARYLKGDYARSAEDWTRTRDAGRNADNLVSASHWLFTTLTRLGRQTDAAAVLTRIRPDLDVIENGSYFALLRLYKGERTEADVLRDAGEGASATAVRYGVSVWHQANGRAAEAARLRELILAGLDWPSFGHIGAEVDTVRARTRMVP